MRGKIDIFQRSWYFHFLSLPPPPTPSPADESVPKCELTMKYACLDGLRRSTSSSSILESSNSVSSSAFSYSASSSLWQISSISPFLHELLSCIVSWQSFDCFFYLQRSQKRKCRMRDVYPPYLFRILRPLNLWRFHLTHSPCLDLWHILQPQSQSV